MSVSQILNSNGKIPSSLVDGGGSGPATIPPLVSVLTVGADAGNLFIDNLKKWEILKYGKYTDIIKNVYD
jgi:hypothetical protein